MRYFIALFLLSISTFSSGQTELLDAKKLWARDSIRLGTNWIRSVSRDTALLTVTDRDIPSAKAVKEFVLNRWNNGLVPWGNVTGKPSLLISGNNLADVSNVATARTNLSVYSIATVNDSLLNHYTKSQSDARFKSIDWFPTIANVTGLPDSLTNLQARIQTKLTKSDADTYYPAIQRMLDSLTAVQARVQTKEPFISPGTSAQYWRGDKTWQTLDKSAVGLSAVPNVDATNPANISQSELYRFVTDTEKSTWNAKQSALGYTPENIANKGIANGYADLDAGGKIPASRIDFGQTGQTFVVASQSAMLAVSGANIGALAIRTDQNKNYRLIAQPASTLANWQVLLSPDAPVQSVNGFTGNVNLLTTHISEGSNYWWTAARSRAAQSLTVSGSSGSATYDNTTGVLNIPTYTLAGLGGQPALSGTGFVKISGTTITYDNSTYLTSYTETDPTIYSWAKAASKPSYSWGEITGTVPTWNQNTTGNAATATTATNWSGSSALGSYAYRSSGLAELSGASFSGAISFSGTSTSNGRLNIYGPGTTSATYGLVVDPSGGGVDNFTVRDDGQIYMRGNVGIGTASPNARLHVQSGVTELSNGATDGVDDTQLIFSAAGYPTSYLHKITTAHSASIDQGWMQFSLASSASTYNHVMRLMQNGSIGIGTSNPAARLHVAIPSVINTNTEVLRLSDGILVDFKFYLNRGTTQNNSIAIVNTYGGIMSFETLNTERGRITASGNWLINTTTDDGINKLQVNGGASATSFTAGTGSSQTAIGSKVLDFYNASSSVGKIRVVDDATTVDAMTFSKSGSTSNVTVPNGTITSTGFIKSGSSDSYFLLGGGGHVATSTYATTASLSGYVDMSSNQYEIGGNKTFLADVVVNGKLTGSRILASTASYTTTATISSTITTAFCSGSSYTLTLPSASGVTGQILTVISNSNLTGITLSGVEGGSYTLICNSSLVLVSNGTTWKIASAYQNSGACS